jgi:hypothetical protein
MITYTLFISGGAPEAAPPSEDEFPGAREGEQAIPGVAKPKVIDDDRVQNPKPIDPGHTA